METLKLNLRSNSQPVVLEHEDGHQEEYELREMKASARDKYVDALSTRISKDASGNPIIKKFDGMQADLLCLTLYKKADGALVVKEEIQKWPTTAVSQLFEAASNLNRLTVEGDKPKNA